MTFQMTTYKGFTISTETNTTYAIRDEHGYWVGDEGTLAFAKERVDEILGGRK